MQFACSHGGCKEVFDFHLLLRQFQSEGGQDKGAFRAPTTCTQTRQSQDVAPDLGGILNNFLQVTCLLGCENFATGVCW